MGYSVYEGIQALFREATKAKAKGAAGAAPASKADLFKQMMRPRCGKSVGHDTEVWLMLQVQSRPLPRIVQAPILPPTPCAGCPLCPSL